MKRTQPQKLEHHLPDERKRPGRMKGILLIVLLIAMLTCSLLAGPVGRLQLSTPSGFQSRPVERGPTNKTPYASAFSVSPRLRRAIVVVPKIPIRICTGCFSVIGDPTIPQQ